MSEASTTRRFPLFLSFALLALGLAVFVWGLAYKLSLYEMPLTSTHEVPSAKLLSRDEDPNASDTLRICATLANALQPVLAGFAVSLFLCWLVTLLSGPSAQLSRRRLLTGRQRRPRLLRQFLPAFSFRPPPALLRL